MELSSFTKTALLLKVSQSAVTKRIDALEEEAAVQLVVRDKRSVIPTARGRTFLEYAKKILDMERLAISAVSDGKTCFECVNVGCVTSLLLMRVSNMIVSFMEKTPEISVNIACGSSNELLNMLYDSRLDVCFSFFPFSENNYCCTECFEDEIMLVASPKNNCYPEGISVERLRTLPLIKDNFSYIADPNWFEYVYSGVGQKILQLGVGSFEIPFLIGGIGYGFVAGIQAQPFLESGELVRIKILGRERLTYKSYLIHKSSVTDSTRCFVRHMIGLLENQ